MVQELTLLQLAAWYLLGVGERGGEREKRERRERRGEMSVVACLFWPPPQTRGENKHLQPKHFLGRAPGGRAGLAPGSGWSGDARRGLWEELHGLQLRHGGGGGPLNICRVLIVFHRLGQRTAATASRLSSPVQLPHTPAGVQDGHMQPILAPRSSAVPAIFGQTCLTWLRKERLDIFQRDEGEG